MKLTSQENIAQNEKKFIDTINAELDWEAIEKRIFEKHQFALQEDIDCKNGNLIVHKESIAYKFDFEIKIPLSVIFNREGDCLEISTQRDDFENNDEHNLIAEDDKMSHEKYPVPDNKTDQMASSIADMISQINDGDESRKG